MLEFFRENLLFIGLAILFIRFVIKQKNVTFIRMLVYIIFLVYLYQVFEITGVIKIITNYQAFDVSGESLGYSFKNSQFIPFLFFREGMALNNNDFIQLLFSSYFRASLYNFIMLIPLGIFIPWLYKYKFPKTFAYGFTVVFVIEVIQFISNIASLSTRSFNIDDFILNLLGVSVGYLLFSGVIKKALPPSFTK